MKKRIQSLLVVLCLAVSLLCVEANDPSKKSGDGQLAPNDSTSPIVIIFDE